MDFFSITCTSSPTSWTEYGSVGTDISLTFDSDMPHIPFAWHSAHADVESISTVVSSGVIDLITPLWEISFLDMVL